MKTHLTAPEQASLQELLMQARRLTTQLDEIESTIGTLLEMEHDDDGVITEAVCDNWTVDRLLVELHIDVPVD
jgi:hypothetical protein